MCAALDYTRAGDNGDLRLVLKIADRKCSAVAHRMLDLAERQSDIVLEASRIRNILVNAFFK